jgi:(2Fe-2S) ferredoxin
MQNKQAYFEYHIFFCTNSRKNGKQSCAQYNAEEMREYAKQQCKIKGLNKVRVNQAGCLGRCEHGPVAVIYPEGTWYTYIDKDDINCIIDLHLEKGEKVERLIIKD